MKKNPKTPDFAIEEKEGDYVQVSMRGFPSYEIKKPDQEYLESSGMTLKEYVRKEIELAEWFLNERPNANKMIM